MNPHITDALYWLAFAAGQLLFLLKRADLAVRSPMNGVKTKRAYFQLNWVPLLFRSALEFAVIFCAYRYLDINALVRHMGWNLPFQIPQSPIVALLLGMFSDSMMDWLLMREKILGVPIPPVLKENIPQIPEVQRMVVKLNGEKKNGPA